MNHFKNWLSYYKFVTSVTRNSRYIHDGDAKEFIEALEKSLVQRETSVKNGSLFWRAQIGYAEDEIIHDNEVVDVRFVPHPKSRMIPNPILVNEGRANPKGIACLYLSTSDKTAVSEVRPWVESKVTLATFSTLKSLKIVDCSVFHGKRTELFYEDTPDEIHKSVWKDIDNAFSKPVSLNDQDLAYVPTQIIAEVIKSNGYEGIAYKSVFGNGYNLVVFDPNLVEMGSRRLVEIRSLSYEFDDFII